MELAKRFPAYGSQMLHLILKREGLVVNHKRTERVYNVLNLAHIKRKISKKKVPYPRVMVAPDKANKVWNMDFVSDAMTTG